MADKKSFVLRMDNGTYEALERWAADEFRSINGQIEYLLHQALASTGRLQSKKDTNTKKGSDKNAKKNL